MNGKLGTIEMLDSLISTSNSLLLEANNFLTNYEINWQHYKILDELCRCNAPKSSIELKALFPGKRPDMTRLVDVLEKKNFITRKINSENRRKIDIQVTKEGSKCCQEVGEKLNRIIDLESKLSKEDYETVMNSLKIIRSI